MLTTRPNPSILSHNLGIEFQLPTPREVKRNDAAKTLCKIGQFRIDFIDTHQPNKTLKPGYRHIGNSNQENGLLAHATFVHLIYSISPLTPHGYIEETEPPW